MESGDSSDAPPARRAGGAEVEGPRKDDDVLLADEKFDFDLSLSSLSANEDDEVFFGPVGHRERCIAARVEGSSRSPEARHFRWSPLAGDQFVEVYKEAHLLAFQIESSSRRQAAHTAGPEDAGRPGGERFLQDSQSKMSLFEKENKRRRSPGSLKRETYSLSDSPLSGPPLSGVQPASGVGPRSTAAAQAQLTRTRGPPHPPRPSLPLDPSPARPPSQAATQRKVVSRLPPPRASVRGKSAHLAVEKSAKETLASPSGSKTAAEKESQGDRPPDTPSAARDITGVPACGGRPGPGRRSLPVPSKVGVRRTGLKPPGCSAGLARKPGAPGGFLGGSSRACAPPVGGTGKPGEHRSVSADGSRPPSDPGQPGPAGDASAPPPRPARPAAVGRQSWCPGRPAAPTAPALPQPQTREPGGAGLSSQPRLPRSARRSAAGGARRESSLHSGTKAVPAPASPFKVPPCPAGGPPDSATPRLSRAPRPQSCTSTGEPLQFTQLQTGPPQCGPSARGVVPLPVQPETLTAALGLRRGAAARTGPPTGAPLLRRPCRRLSASPRRRAASPSPVSPRHKHRMWPSPLRTRPRLRLCWWAPRCSSSTPPPAARSSPPAADVALIDFCSPPGAGGPLIDLLLNTPDADRSAAAKLPPHVGQLVGLCAPLIQLSPEANKENVDSPLLKF